MDLGTDDDVVGVKIAPFTVPRTPFATFFGAIVPIALSSPLGVERKAGEVG